MKIYKSIIAVVFSAALFFGCSADQNSDKNTDQLAETEQVEESMQGKKDDSGITETYWKLVSLQGKEVSMPEDQREAHIKLMNKEGKVTGSGGCNVLNGSFELGDGNSISFSKVATTMMSCPDMETEQQFLKVLEKVNSYQVEGDTLLLNDSNGETLAKFVSAPEKKN